MKNPSAESFAANEVLFGHDATPGIIAVEPIAGGVMRVYSRTNGTLAHQDHPFTPFLWVAEQVHLQSFDAKVDFVRLNGEGRFKFLAKFQSWTDFQRARKTMESEAFYALNDPVQQFLTATGQTLFKSLHLEDLRRMRLAIVTSHGKLQAIQLADAEGWQLEIVGANEHAMIKQFVAVVTARDPDVLEGHDIFRGGLDTIQRRARATRATLALGRDGSKLTGRASRIQIAERTIQYPKYQIHGRHVVDTVLLTHFYDISSRELEGFELDDVAKHFGVESLAAVEATGRISDLLSPSYFIQAQIFPYNYQDVIIRGNATKIDALFLREYLHRHQAIPALDEVRFFAGGYTDMFATGVVRTIWHADVQSLYPSLIVTFDIKPKCDELNLYVSLLRDLREFRLKAKTAARQAADDTQRRYFEALQQTFKILINSFYGYLGFSQGHFSDFNAAEAVTTRGREILKLMLDWLNREGARVIEIDTDGLYFVPPPNTSPERLTNALQQVLPKGVEVEIDGCYPAMFSYKMKNYALLEESGRLRIKGSALRSRGLEKFQRQFLEEMLSLALQGAAVKIPQLYEAYRQRIEQRTFPIEMLAKNDTLQDSLDIYQQKIAQSARNRSAPYELALQSGEPYQAGDRVSFYITGDDRRISAYENAKLVEQWDPTKRDENVDYYLDKMHALYKKLGPVIAPEIVTADVAKPKRRPSAPEGTLDLFG